MRLLFLCLLVFILACSTKAVQKNQSPEQKIINDAIKAHGGKLYDTANYAFEFRSKQYTFKHKDSRYEYTMQQTNKGQQIDYFMDNDKFVRSIDGEVQELDAKASLRYSNSLNSVIYFALLPYRLNDPAVRKAYKGKMKIKGANYDMIEVRFTEEGGGTDHDDIYYYWVNEQTKTIDYLAYSFHVNGGGVRFRNAFNPVTVDGIRFQDYENYSADKDTPLEELPALFEQKALKLLSKIELKNIRKN